MTFTKIENYDGQKGYLAGGITKLNVVEFKGFKYLIDDDFLAYRVVSVNEKIDTAVAAKITNQDLVNKIYEQHCSDLEARLEANS